jgi:hypothetical protein
MAREIGTTIPPKTIVRLITADDFIPKWKQKIGKRYRVGYYNPQDGLDLIWLVDDDGNYCETTNREYLLKYFEIMHLSNEDDFFGENRAPLSAIRVNNDLAS